MKRQQFNSLLELLNSGCDVHYSEGRREIKFPANTDLSGELETNFAGYFDLTAEGAIITNLPSPNLPFFYSTENFLKDFDEQIFQGDFGVLIQEDVSGNPYHGIFYDSTTQNFYLNDQVTHTSNSIRNNIFYRKLKTFISNPDNGLTDYFDAVKNRLVIVTGTKGVMNIGYPTISPEFNNQYDLERLYQKTLKNFETKGYTNIFKFEVYDNVKSVKEEERLPHLIKNLDIVFENSDRNFEIYMSEFSFDKLKDSLKQEKLKYYNLTRDVLSKIYAQIASVPIAISASALATYKVTDKQLLLFILIVFVSYAFFIWRLSRTLKHEIKSVKVDFLLEKEDIIKYSKLEAKAIKIELDIIIRRISSVSKTITTFQVVFITLTLIFIIYLLCQLNANTINPSKFWFV